MVGNLARKEGRHFSTERYCEENHLQPVVYFYVKQEDVEDCLSLKFIQDHDMETVDYITSDKWVTIKIIL